MKKISYLIPAAFVLCLLMTSTALAWWTANARVTVRSTFIESSVVNNTNSPMYCSGVVYGRTYTGHILRNQSSGWVAPNGGYGTIYVYSSPSNPFQNGWADVKCKW